MPRVEEIDFPHEYLFNSVKNHELFVDWAMNIKDDSSLLLTLLERLTADTETKNQYEEDGEGGKVLQSPDKEKGPIRVAHAYAQMQRMTDHEFNIFESAFFEEFQGRRTGRRTRRGIAALLQASLVVATQIFFTCVIITETVWKFRPFQSGERFYLICPIAILSTIAFFFAVMTHGYRSSNFNAIVSELACFDKSTTKKESFRFQDMRIVQYIDFSFTSFAQKLCLLLNTISNQWIGAALVVLNIPFVSTAENPTEAILNALATGFIIEIDDLVRRIVTSEQMVSASLIDWNNDRTEQLMVGLATQYVSNPNFVYDFQEVFVQKHCPVEHRHSERPFRNGEECHTFVVQKHISEKYENARTISVLIKPNNGANYDHVKYVVSGPGMQSFIDDVSEFDCYRPWKLRAEFLETFGETLPAESEMPSILGMGTGGSRQPSVGLSRQV